MHRTQLRTVSAADTDNDLVVTPAVILRGAARYLETHGWTQHTYYGSDTTDVLPPACADGAIGMAAYGRITICPGRETQDPGYRDYLRAVDYLNGYLLRIGYQPPCDSWCPGGTDCLCCNDESEVVFAWNDDEQCIKDDVVRGLNAAADDYDRTHGGTR